MVKRIVSIILLLVVVYGGNIGARNVPEEVKDVVTFIFVKNDKGEIVPNGTGFFVSVKNESNPETQNIYLVTAKHVLMNEKTGSLFSSIFIRLNKKTGDSETFEIPLQGSNAAKIFKHNDPTVDITLIPMLPNPDFFQCRWIAQDMITTREIFKESKIKAGDDVFFVGLFIPYYGIQRNYPIVRFGKVALITDEKIPWKVKGKPPEMLDLYLVELQSFGGSSGSPVFFYLDPARDPGQLVLGAPKLLLAGVMKGTFFDLNEIQFMETKKIPISQENIGIAAIIPAYRLQELLFSDEIKKDRLIQKK